MNDLIFSYVLRPYALGVKSLSILMAPMPDGDFEAFALCESVSGRSDATRLTFHKTVALTAAIEKTQIEAQSLLPDPSIPVAWIGSTNEETMRSELGFAFGAVEEALRFIKSTTLLSAIVYVKPLGFQPAH